MVQAVEVVLFDAAGTLFELKRSVGETYSAAAARHGVVLPAWRLDDAFARVMRGADPMAFPEDRDFEPAAVDAFERNWWCDRVRQVLMATDSTTRFAEKADGQPGFDAFFAELWEEYAGRDAWQLRGECRETLATLQSQNLRLGVASNFDHRLEGLLHTLGIASFFDVVVRPGIVGSAKPEPRLFEAALAALGTSSESACYVGDDADVDGTAAAACGVRFIDVSKLPSLRDLPALLQAS